MAEEIRRQTLCDKRHNIILCLKKKNICQTSPSFLKTDLFVKDKNAVFLSEDYDKTRK